MIRMRDQITGEFIEYEDVEEFKEAAKYSYDESVHHVIDELADAISSNGCTVELEALEVYLGMELEY